MAETQTNNVPLRVIGLWFLAAVLEGIDLQSAGIAGAGIAAEFGLGAAQMGWIFTAGGLGLCMGAAVGGRLADSHGRKNVLIGAIVVYGIFSIATAHSGGNLPVLALYRALTGFGLGGAIPNLIALVAESTSPRNRNTLMGLMYCGMPLGSAAIAAIGWLGIGEFGWRLIFYAGGIAPLIIAPLFVLALPESPAFAGRGTMRPSAPEQGRAANILFGEGRWNSTLALWISSFCTYFVLYLLLNWLPQLLLNKGFDSRGAAAVMILFNLGGMMGIVAGGMMMDRFRHRYVIAFVYGAVIAALLTLTYVNGIAAILIAAFAADFFITASQMIQYSLAPGCYPLAQRGAGVGFMVAVGRTGSIAGPLLAGQLLAAGAAGSVVIIAGIPGLLASAVVLLASRASRD